MNSQIPTFVGVIVLGISVSFIGNVVGLLISDFICRRFRIGPDRAPIEVLGLLLIAGSKWRTKVAIAVLTAVLSARAYGDVAAALNPTLFICGAIGLAFTFLTRFSRS